MGFWKVLSMTNFWTCLFKVVDAIRPGIPHYSVDYQEFAALQYTLFISVFVSVLSGFFFIAAGWFYEKDKTETEMAIALSRG